MSYLEYDKLNVMVILVRLVYRQTGFFFCGSIEFCANYQYRAPDLPIRSMSSSSSFFTPLSLRGEER